jgi:hypothetical protein
MIINNSIPQHMNMETIKQKVLRKQSVYKVIEESSSSDSDQQDPALIVDT